jgi:uncharacterized protein YbjT (DUF2867 family)
MRKAIIIGSTGLVGKNLVELLSESKSYARVYCISRGRPEHQSEKLIHIPVNSGNYEMPPSCTTAFCCLGTTMKKAGSKGAFKKVDLEMVIDFALKAKEAGVTRFAVVSSIGANAQSSNFYLKTKGEMEDHLKKIGFERLVFVRPSLLLGNRNERRFGEDAGKVLDAVLKFVLVGSLRKYRGIQAKDVAKAMIRLIETDNRMIVVESDKLVEIAATY